MRAHRVTVLCGGVGAARFLAGLVQVVDPASVTAVVNTGDDAVINGLAISPDLDTVVYTLAGAIDPERGWGLGGETWNAMAALERYQASPAGGLGGRRHVVQPRRPRPRHPPLPHHPPRRGGDAQRRSPPRSPRRGACASRSCR